MSANQTKKLCYRERFILSCLRKGRQNKEGLIQEYEDLVHIMGLPISFSDRSRGWTFHRRLDRYLDNLQGLGLVNYDDGLYGLTKSGEEKAEQSQESIKARNECLRSLSRSPETASIVSVFSNSAMALLKLVAGFLFNSMALIADGFDSLVDVISAITVFLGIKHERELVSSTFVIAMMFGTAGYIGCESVTRLISPEPLEVSPLAIIAAVISGSVCYVMSIYQHYVGKRSGSISLLTQSVDSRNHTFQAMAVLIGLGFAAFGVYIVDAIVALLVAGLIFQSAIELLRETFRIAKGEELELSRFSRKYEKAVSSNKREFFKFWILLNLRVPRSREEITRDYESTFNHKESAISTAVQPMNGFDFENQLESILNELESDGLVRIEGNKISLTTRGKHLSDRRTQRARFGIPI